MKLSSRSGRMLSLLVLLMLCVVFIQGVSQAQPMRRTPKERAAMLKEQLSLSDSQVVIVTKIYEVSDTLMRKIFESAGDNREAVRDTMMAIRKKIDDQVVALLNEEQKKKYAEIQKQRENRGPGRMRRD